MNLAWCAATRTEFHTEVPDRKLLKNAEKHMKLTGNETQSVLSFISTSPGRAAFVVFGPKRIIAAVYRNWRYRDRFRAIGSVG